jgi:IS30 family transposase
MGARSYKRISSEEREEISRYLAIGTSYQGISKHLNRAVSTITREVGKGSVRRCSYRAGLAQKRAERNARKRRAGRRKIREYEPLKGYVEAKLLLKWSPEQIAKRIKKKYPINMKMRISHEAIYAYVYVMPKGTLKKEILKSMRHRHKRRYLSRNGKLAKPLKDMVSIDERPAEVESREIPGHWEGDLIIGRNRQSALGTLTERQSRFGLLVRLNGKSAEEVRKRFGRKLKQLPKHARLSMTYDQGREMAGHALLTKETEVQVYFAHKGCPWERGTNENFNGLVRQFFPKGTDFNAVSDYQINKAQDLLNGRPRKVLDFDTPYEVFSRNVALKP